MMQLLKAGISGLSKRKKKNKNKSSSSARNAADNREYKKKMKMARRRYGS